MNRFSIPKVSHGETLLRPMDFLDGNDFSKQKTFTPSY